MLWLLSSCLHNWHVCFLDSGMRIGILFCNSEKGTNEIRFPLSDRVIDVNQKCIGDSFKNTNRLIIEQKDWCFYDCYLWSAVIIKNDSELLNLWWNCWCILPQVVDMRWGVREEAQDDHMTSELCIKEIHKCQRISVGPTFVVRCRCCTMQMCYYCHLLHGILVY